MSMWIRQLCKKVHTYIHTKGFDAPIGNNCLKSPVHTHKNTSCYNRVHVVVCIPLGRSTNLTYVRNGFNIVVIQAHDTGGPPCEAAI
jgi:hypothetical protein